MLISLASVQDLDARIPGGVGDDVFRAQAALDDASALVRAEAGVTWVDGLGALDEVPDVAVAVTLAAARRAFVNPNMLEAETVGPFSANYASASPDVYLTKAEKALVRRAASRTGLWTLSTTRVDAAADTPTVHAAGWADPTIPEEYDPYSAGWTG